MAGIQSAEIGGFTNMTATANVKATQGAMLGFYVNSTSSGTIQFYDSATTTTTVPISGLITPAIGFHRFPAAYASGLYAVIASTLNVTIFWV